MCLKPTSTCARWQDSLNVPPLAALLVAAVDGDAQRSTDRIETQVDNVFREPRQGLELPIRHDAEGARAHRHRRAREHARHCLRLACLGCSESTCALGCGLQGSCCAHAEAPAARARQSAHSDASKPSLITTMAKRL